MESGIGVVLTAGPVMNKIGPWRAWCEARRCTPMLLSPESNGQDSGEGEVLQSEKALRGKLPGFAEDSELRDALLRCGLAMHEGLDGESYPASTTRCAG